MIRMGIDGKLYYTTDAGGIGTAAPGPTWTELTNVKNVTCGVSAGEADITTRTNNGWKAIVATLLEGNFEFEMAWDDADAGFNAIAQAFFGRKSIGLAVLDRAVTDEAAKGIKADCMITGFTRDENLEQAMTVKVTAKPTYSATAPQPVGFDPES